MRQNPSFTLQDPEELKRLIRQNPWATLVSMTGNGLVASHYPVVLDENRDDLSILSHVGRPDEELHELGRHEVLLIIQGPHGYISPGWYDAKPAVPTWNFVVAHLYGVPELLSAEENYQVLGDLVNVFERVLPEPRLMESTPANAEYAQRISSGTVGLRLTPTRVVAKSKLSQNKPADVVDTILDQLEGDGPYAQPALAAEMRRAHERLRNARRG
ncbi:MAG: FMN-binding negative transcriptional regulator [Naasia sp.]|jgi:transcriptional regulator|uniref:FMN-binding negative transcriptional regulator n=1 Tax=Naasia sp. TaxID=2546198 RepID=UPI00260D96C1|nr:FMN-binding negative transcriptional regulator [Naasia sp.]MCU1569381.1 FMN-binding negative transcriptional regulator [Naasia sp.]